MHRSAQIDQYILKSADFAQPILEHMRHLVHTACPEIEETIKWGSPSFVYKGKILCGMAAFKKHCAFGFWNSENIDDKAAVLEKVGRTAMGNLGRIESLDQLPDSDYIVALIQSAKQQIDSGITKPKAKTVSRALVIPESLHAALQTDGQARDFFEKLSISQKREYAEWIAEAKTEVTINKRLLTTLEWLREGKTRNWKYQR